MSPELNLFNERASEVSSTRFKPRIVRFFPDTNLQGGHIGLSKLAKENGVDVNKLKLGEYLIFVNRKKDKLKMFASASLIAYLKMPPGGRIDPRTIAILPRYFNGTSIQYDEALKEVLDREFGTLQ